MKLPWKKAESDLEREVRFHLESLAAEFVRQGMSRKEAELAARREFGGVDQVKELCRDESVWSPLAQVQQDVTFGLRMLRKTPGVTAATVLSLALGIGATTAIVSVAGAVLWRSIGVPNPEQLTEILWQSKGRAEGILRGSSGSNFPEGPMRVADFFNRAMVEKMRALPASKVVVAAHTHPRVISTSYEGRTAVARTRAVSGNFFPMLAVQPAQGRLLAPHDDDSAAPMAVVISHHFWSTRLNREPQAAGRELRINNRQYTIAGVLPEEYRGIVTGENTDIYTTIRQSAAYLEQDSWYRKGDSDPMTWYMQLLARRAPGVTNEQLHPELDALFRSSWGGPLKNAEAAPTLRLVPAAGGLGGLRRQLGDPLTMLMVLVALVLLVACANIANLLLARADARRKEVALRVSLGCGRARLVRQFFTESALLAAAGGIASVVVAVLTARTAVALMDSELRLDVPIDARMLGVTALVSMAAAFVFGLYPAWRAAKADASPALKEGNGSIGGARGSRFSSGKALVLFQVALGVLLVTSAVTFTLHLRKILNTDAGFERTRLLLFDLRPGETGHKGGKLVQFCRDLERRLKELPGVTAVGISSVRPMMGGGWYSELNPPGGQKPISTAANSISAGYLDALGLKLLAGRGFTAQDIGVNSTAALITENVAKQLGGSALGMRARFGDQDVEIVGIVSDAHYGRLTDEGATTLVAQSFAQDSFTVLLRTNVPPGQLINAASGVVAELDKDLPLVNPRSMEEQIGHTLRRERLFAWLCGAFGVLALVLCMVGLYGVMSYATVRRSQEIGIRMALGASPKTVLGQVVTEGMALACLGLLIGGPAAYYLAMKFVDYKRLAMEPLQPATLGWAVGALAAAALVAVFAPALRAASVEPLEALRHN